MSKYETIDGIKAKRLAAYKPAKLKGQELRQKHLTDSEIKHHEEFRPLLQKIFEAGLELAYALGSSNPPELGAV